MIGLFRRHRRLGALALAGLIVAAGGAYLLLRPATTRQGLDYTVTTYELPTYVKAIDFLQRHYYYRLLVSRVCAGKPAPEDCVLALLDWTHRNIPPTPAGWPVVDDHPSHIVIRGHGQSDQIADVFTILATYAGVPAFFQFLMEPQSGAQLVLAFAEVDGIWATFDVERGLAFRTRDGALASVEELMRDAALVDGQAPPVAEGVPYSAFFAARTLRPFTVPRTLRGELQQPWSRLRYEARRLVGLERE